MSRFSKKWERIVLRAKLIRAALFSKFKTVGQLMESAGILHEFELRGRGNPFEILGRDWATQLHTETLKLCKSVDAHIESSERDVLELLYDLCRKNQPRTVMEIGVYHGAGSLSLAQGLHDNGGGVLHLVDISQDYLNDVQARIDSRGWKVDVRVHPIDPETGWDSKPIPECGLLFIDASHQYLHVKRDVETYWPQLATGGWMVLHDTVKHEGARRVAMEWGQRGVKVITLATSQGSGVSLLRKEK